MRKTEQESDVSMTPMIDVVFQLLIYFLVTFTTPDIFAQLDVSRSVEKNVETNTSVQMISIEVQPQGFRLNGRAVLMDELVSTLHKLAGLKTDQPVLITCLSHSEHNHLIQLLDVCAQVGLANLSVASRE